MKFAQIKVRTVDFLLVVVVCLLGQATTNGTILFRCQLALEIVTFTNAQRYYATQIDDGSLCGRGRA